MSAPFDVMPETWPGLVGAVEPVQYRVGVASTRDDWRDVAYMRHGAALALSPHDGELSDKYNRLRVYAWLMVSRAAK